MAKSEIYSVKQEIKHAVMQLMTKQSYMDITVTDIVNKAGVARASFYRNFDSINDVIDEITDDISNELFADTLPVLYGTDERKWREFLFNHFYRFVIKQKEVKNIRFENMSVLFNRMDNRIQKMEANFANDTLRNKYIVVGKMGLINSITKKWMDDGMKETPEEMIDFIMSFIVF